MKKIKGILISTMFLLITSCANDPIDTEPKEETSNQIVLVCESEEKTVMTHDDLKAKIQSENITHIHIWVSYPIFPTNPVDSRTITSFSTILDFEYAVYVSGNTTLRLSLKSSPTSSDYYTYYLLDPILRFRSVIE